MSLYFAVNAGGHLLVATAWCQRSVREGAGDGRRLVGSAQSSEREKSVAPLYPPLDESLRGPTPPSDHDPHGPDNSNYSETKCNNKKKLSMITTIIIIIGPVGVMVIRGRGRPLYKSRSLATAFFSDLLHGVCFIKSAISRETPAPKPQSKSPHLR